MSYHIYVEDISDPSVFIRFTERNNVIREVTLHEITSPGFDLGVIETPYVHDHLIK